MCPLHAAHALETQARTMIEKDSCTLEMLIIHSVYLQQIQVGVGVKGRCSPHTRVMRHARCALLVELRIRTPVSPLRESFTEAGSHLVGMLKAHGAPKLVRLNN